MGSERTTETLWVEPRLRGFVVTADPRNPPSRLGEFLPYAAGWRIAGRAGRRIPAGPGVRPISGVRLRVATARAELWTMGAIERDLRRRVREGELDYVLRPRRATTSKWIPRTLFAIAAGAIVPGVLHAPEWLMLSVMVFVFGMFSWPMTRRNVRHLRIHSGRIEIERTDGPGISRPLSALRTMRQSLDAREIAFDDGSSVWLAWPVRDKSLWRALRSHFTRPTAEVEARHARRAVYRLLFVYAPLFGVVLMIGPALTKIPTGELFSPNAIAAYKRMAIGSLVLFALPICLLYFAMTPLARLRFARMRSKGRPRPSSPQFIFEPLERETTP